MVEFGPTRTDFDRVRHKFGQVRIRRKGKAVVGRIWARELGKHGPAFEKLHGPLGIGTMLDISVTKLRLRRNGLGLWGGNSSEGRREEDRRTQCMGKRSRECHGDLSRGVMPIRPMFVSNSVRGGPMSQRLAGPMMLERREGQTSPVDLPLLSESPDCSLSVTCGNVITLKEVTSIVPPTRRQMKGDRR